MEMARPGALTSAQPLPGARAIDPAALRRIEQPVGVPTLLIWGDHDPHAQVDLTRDLPMWATHGRVAHLPDAGHFSHQEEPERVNQLLTDFLAS